MGNACELFKTVVAGLLDWDSFHFLYSGFSFMIPLTLTYFLGIDMIVFVCLIVLIIVVASIGGCVKSNLCEVRMGNDSFLIASKIAHPLHLSRARYHPNVKKSCTHTSQRRLKNFRQESRKYVLVGICNAYDGKTDMIRKRNNNLLSQPKRIQNPSRKRTLAII